MTEKRYILWLDNLTNKDAPVVGGKNASLGEMIQSLKEERVSVPGGFATTADAYREFLEANELDTRLKSELEKLKNEEQSLEQAGKAIRRMIRGGEFPQKTAEAIRGAYREMCDKQGTEEVAVAVRSSATAEDLPDASFAGQHETYLNITGENDLLDACRKCFASLFTDRAIAYREEHGFEPSQHRSFRRCAEDGSGRQGRFRCDVLDRHRIGLSRRGRHQCRLGPG